MDIIIKKRENVTGDAKGGDLIWKRVEERFFLGDRGGTNEKAVGKLGGKPKKGGARKKCAGVR